MDYPLVGYHSLEEALKTGKCQGTLYISKRNKRIETLEELAHKTGVPVAEVSTADMDKLARGGDHRGALLILTGKSETRVVDSLKSMAPLLKGEDRIVLILDGITDPHNFGAILRSADQFAVDLVIYQERRSAGQTDVVARSSAGALHHVNLLCVTNLARTLEELKDLDFWIFATDMAGKPINTTNLRGKTALVLGSEGGGIRRLVREKCDFFISIPTFGQVDSLNVSVAAGVVLYEARRQRISSSSSG